jgi:hypothetical protein
MFPVLPPKQVLKSAPTAVEIYQYDASPMGSRQPVLLVHGLKDEHVRMFNWQQTCQYLTSSQEFRQRYKIYLARFDTHASAQKSAEAFKPAIKELASEQKHPVIVVALSIAGNVVRNAMADRSVDRSVDRLITLGTPFRGSPLFSKEWMQYSMLKGHKLSVGHFDRYVAYKIYFHLHSNLLSDYYWDNCDQRIPSIGRYQFRFPITARGFLSPPAVPPPGASISSSRNKIIAYAAYLQYQPAAERQQNGAYRIVQATQSFWTTTIPAHLGRQHAVLRLLNPLISSVVQNSPNQQSAYVLNDGITTLVSAVSLPESAALKNSIDGSVNSAVLASQVDLRKTRIFAGADHLTFIDGRRPRGLPAEIPDQLSPNEKPRSMFAWLLTDILN